MSLNYTFKISVSVARPFCGFVMIWPNMTDNNSIILDCKVVLVVLLKQSDKFPQQLVSITS